MPSAAMMISAVATRATEARIFLCFLRFGKCVAAAKILEDSRRK
jgi:hypothetical protein